MMTSKPLIAGALAALLLTSACGKPSSDEPVRVSVVGEHPRLANPSIQALKAADAILIAAVAQGLVRYDAAGQIEPGLAIRWAISDDGLYYTFRLAAIEGVTAELVAAHMRRMIAPRSRNSLKPLLGAIREIVAVTPEVVEIRLMAPRPNLLDLLAQPEMAIFLPRTGTGPLAMTAASATPIRLAPAAPENGDISGLSDSRHIVMLRGERAAMAIARYVEGQSDLVLGGRFGDLAIARAALPRARDIRFDPVNGLFGLRFVGRGEFLGAGENRRALSMALDRSQLLSLFGSGGWSEVSSLMPVGTYDLPRPMQPGWSGVPLSLRREAAAATIAAWRRTQPDVAPIVRVALPDGPGSRLLFAALRSSWRSIGVETVRVAHAENPDLVLVDEVAPSQSASWYLLRLSCLTSTICSETAEAGLKVARETADPVERAARLADVDLRLAEITPYIPIAQPLRWSLASPRLQGIQSNIRGVHPLNHLLETAR